MDKESKEIISILLLIFLPIILFFASFLLGRYPIAPFDVINTLLCPIFPQCEVSPTITTIVFEIRLPRILGAFVVGSSLAMAGVAFQSIFKNPLVSSDLLGVSNGAGFGAALAEKAIEKGLAQGIEQGIEQGLEQGREEGIEGVLKILSEEQNISPEVIRKIEEYKRECSKQ